MVWETTQEQEFKQIITGKPFRREIEDTWVWKIAEVGVFSVRSAYTIF